MLGIESVVLRENIVDLVVCHYARLLALIQQLLNCFQVPESVLFRIGALCRQPCQSLKCVIPGIAASLSRRPRPTMLPSQKLHQLTRRCFVALLDTRAQMLLFRIDPLPQ